MQQDFFPVFAEWARKQGLEEAGRRFAGVLGDDLAAYVAEYERRMQSVQSNEPPVLHGPTEPWYPGPVEDDVYWPQLRDHFIGSLGWDDHRIRPVDHASSKVLAYTPSPVERTWASRGLVVGYVQSGKTTNFTAVIAKAADVGYKLIIVLSGIHNGLRRQTQQRLDEQLHDLNPASWMVLTDQADDFRGQAIGATALLHNQENVALCVVKKNARVLNRLDGWLEAGVRARVFAGVPTLVIDDEADQASVATGAINPLILRILGKLPRCTYIGYTATPFANVLIDPAAEDLYPKDFILNLPRPEGYFGTERIFGRDAVEGDEANGTDLDGFDMVRFIDDAELDHLRPAGRAAAAAFMPTITESLDDAIRWFWLATAARRARKDVGHSTMLIHTSMKIAVHLSFKDPLVELRDDIAAKLLSGDAATIEKFRKQWKDESGRVPADQLPDLPVTTFEEVLDNLPQVVADTKIILDNCASEDRLDYSGEPQVAIAVGGNTLSRGLTLEGLVVSYFVRSAQAYDTLLQMARWFGFRPGYEDLPRIWMTGQLESYFRHLATVEHEIRLDIDRYEQLGLTPEEFGVRIRTHPQLRITAKMGAARPAYASYGGRRIQTRFFRENDKDWLEANLAAADALVRDARAGGAVVAPLSGGAALLRDVGADVVERFLDSYESHADSPDLDAQLVLRYIHKQRQAASLDLWNVAVMAGPSKDHGTVRLGGVEFGRIERAKLKSSVPGRADIKTLMSKDHRVVDLDITPRDARAMSESSLMERRNTDPQARKRGLLLLYPIDPGSEPEPQNEKTRTKLGAATDVIGMALVFPGTAEEKSRVRHTYVSVDLSGLDVESPEEAELANLQAEDDR